MRRSEGLRVLAVGIDAAEPTLVRSLMASGALPSLRDLLEHGVWGKVTSPAGIGSGTVWPTFMTGTGPRDHGIYSVLPWDAQEMRLVRLSTDHLTPFWVELSRQGHAVGVLDVPFAPVVGLPRGVEISEWGAHDRLRGQMRASPQRLHDWLGQTAGEHPLGKGRVEVSGPGDRAALRTLATWCRDGARLRGALAARLLREHRLDLLLAVFPEIHHASHYLWHTLDGAAGSRAQLSDTPGLLDVCREVDRQIGHLASLAGPDATILVFSLHGMRATQGIPAILDPLLRALGLAAVKGWRAQTWTERRRSAQAALRGAAPAGLRRLYRKAASRTARPPQPGQWLPYDWSRTSAFPIPTDQHGWIRINVRGRESRGTVDRAQYDDVCSRLEDTLRGLRTTRGGRIVGDVVRAGHETGGPPDRLPDLVVHWDDPALASPLRVRTPRLSATAAGTHFTGQHAPDGFFLLRPAPGRSLHPGESVAAEELHQVIRAGLGSGEPSS